jgi:hypothetical protein
MAEEKKKPEEEEQKKAESPEAEKPEEKKDGSPKNNETEGNSSDDKQADENGEGADSEPEEKPEPSEKASPDVPEMSETDKLKAENLTLKTQLEALKIGFKPDCIEDAVVLAENLVKREGSDITAALQAVAKKYPDWKSDAKSDKSTGGFKVGADSGSKEKNPDSDRLSQAFGIKKKGKV